jgi:hypothetical protein
MKEVENEYRVLISKGRPRSSEECAPLRLNLSLLKQEMHGMANKPQVYKTFKVFLIVNVFKAQCFC